MKIRHSTCEPCCAVNGFNAFSRVLVHAAIMLYACTGCSSHAEISSGYAVEDLQRQLAEVKQGKSDSIWFYDTDCSSGLLEGIQNVPGIRRVGFELCELPDQFVNELLSLPDLREVVFYGGLHRFNDSDLRVLTANRQMESVSLINTDVTNEGLRLLAEFPQLRQLRVFYEPRLGTAITADCVATLARLSELKYLYIGGGWADDANFERLRAEMPNCTVLRDESSGFLGRSKDQ